MRNVLEVAAGFLGKYYDEKKVKMNIEEFRKKGYTEKQIIDAIKYSFGVKQNDPSKSHGGIGILRYTIEESIKHEKWKEKAAKSIMRSNHAWSLQKGIPVKPKDLSRKDIEITNDDIDFIKSGEGD